MADRKVMDAAWKTHRADLARCPVKHKYDGCSCEKCAMAKASFKVYLKEERKWLDEKEREEKERAQEDLIRRLRGITS